MIKGSLTVNRTNFKIEELDWIDFEYLAKYKDLYCISIYLPIKSKSIHEIKKYIESISHTLKQSENHQSFQGLSLEIIQNHLRDLHFILNKWEREDFGFNLIVLQSNEITRAFRSRDVLPFKIYINHHFYLKYLVNKFNKTSHNLISSKTKQKQHKVTDHIDTIIKYSTKGKVKALFLERNSDLCGELDIENDYIMIHDDDEQTTSLSNVAAIQTALNQGDVYILEKKDMPIPSKPINAIIES